MRSFLRYSLCVLILSMGPLCLPNFASQREDTAADAVAKAFVNARQSAHLPTLRRMGRNIFRKQVCQHELRFPAGLINDVPYDTSNPAQLPELARRLAVASDAGKTTVRFAVGVCFARMNSLGQPIYSVVIATYESRGTSFWRIFWE